MNKMDYKAIVLICYLACIVDTVHIPKVYENSTSKQNQENYEKPPTFNYQEYQQAQKENQYDPRRVRYQQQQQLIDNNPRLAKKSEFSTVPTKPFTTTFISTPTLNSEINTTQSQTVLEDLEKDATSNHRRVKSKIAKKSLKPNSYLVNEEEEPAGNRQDDSSSINYLDKSTKSLESYTQNSDQLTALSSLLGQTTENQLQGLHQLLGNKYQHRQQSGYFRDHTPIKEEVLDYPNTPNQANVNIGRPSQGHSNHVVNQALQSFAKHGNNPDALKSLQAQLDATATAHAESIIAQAQKKAFDHLKAQHEAIARAQKQAEQVALEQIKAQNEALARAHAQAEQEAEEKRQEELKAEEEKRIAIERRRQQEAVRERARLAALAYKRKQEQEVREKKEQKEDDKSHDTFYVAKTTRVKNAQKNKRLPHIQNIEPAETQNFIPLKLFPQAQAAPAPVHITKAVTHHTQHTPSAHVPTYEHKYEPTAKYHSEDDHPEVEKYYIPPQITVIGHTKNEHGEQELKYAANYEFGYRIRDHDYGNDYGHKEIKDGETTKGVYQTLLPDGRIQTVSYYVDEGGYHAEVTYGSESSQQ